MLKRFKQATLESLKRLGTFTAVENSRWRRQRLLILAYHGISLADEHLWDHTQFMSPEVFRERLRLIKKSGCTVLPLTEALTRLAANDLPDKSVALTFDDGTYDFYKQAYPAIREFDFPVTLYLTTFYSHYNHPVFNVYCSYLLWKGRARSLDLKPLTGSDRRVSLASPEARQAVTEELREFALAQELSAEEKDALTASLARQLGLDYDQLLAERILHLVRPEEATELAAGGVDIELHTHRHRTPRDRGLFLREIEDNRASVRALTGREPVHFCYPSGIYHPEFLPWLREAGVTSATTCELGFASRESDHLLLPRFLDNWRLSPIEFEGWLTGVSAALPRRRENATRVA